jgi:hypothetical protein
MRFLYVFLMVAAVGCGKKEEAPDLGGGPGADLATGGCQSQADCGDRGLCCGRITPECMTQATATCVRTCNLDQAAAVCPQPQAVYCRSSGECAMAPGAPNCCAPKPGAPAPASDDPLPGVCVPDSLKPMVGGCLPPP